MKRLKGKSFTGEVSYTLSMNEKSKNRLTKKDGDGKIYGKRNFFHSLWLWGKFKKLPEMGEDEKQCAYRLHYNISVYWFLALRLFWFFSGPPGDVRDLPGKAFNRMQLVAHWLNARKVEYTFPSSSFYLSVLVKEKCKLGG